jgi:molecular chaperone IbpA
MLNDSLFIGFPDLNLGKSNNFPPYNILKSGASNYMIELAVAGFTKDELSLSVDKNNLTVKGEKKSLSDPLSYLYKGISSKSFTRVFALANSIEVTSASYEDGILTIKLATKVTELPKTISIS